jgi:hypothetical protein
MEIIETKWSNTVNIIAYVTPGEKVEIHTVENGNLVNVKVFRPGDIAEYDSFNLKYTAQIKAITAKNAIFEMQSWSSSKGSTKRLSWNKFSWRNKDFNVEEVAQYNVIASMNM